MSPSNLTFDSTPIWIKIRDLPVDWQSDAIVRRIVSFVDIVMKIDNFSLSSGSLRSLRVHVCFEFAKALVTGAWILFLAGYVWIEFKYKRLPSFCYYCGKITHESSFCDAIINNCIKFGGEYAQYGEWLHVDMDLDVPKHIKNGELRKKEAEGFVFGSDSALERKKNSCKDGW